LRREISELKTLMLEKLKDQGEDEDGSDQAGDTEAQETG